MRRNISSDIMRNRPDPAVYSQRVIAGYLEQFLKEKPAVYRRRGVEPLHRMRVASRKLRAALGVFEDILPHKKAKRWKKLFRVPGRTLGRGRELDIQLRFLRSAGKQALAAPFKKKRALAQKKICLALANLESAPEFRELKAYLKKDRVGRTRRHGGRGGRSFEHKKSGIILERLGRLLGFRPYVSKPESVQELHRMRIAAKNLRYTLEIFRPWYGRAIDAYIRASRDIQDTLGDLHEFDVWLQSKPRLRAAGLLNTCTALRRDTYRKFLALWKSLENERIWEKLKKAA